MSNISVFASAPIVGRFAERFGIDPNGVLDILKSTAFKTKADGQPATDQQMMALMIVADQYKLNPFTKEIYAYPDKQNGIVPVVGVDGWSRIINEHPALDGIEFNYSEKTVMHKGKTCHEWIECIIHRKDRTRPTVIRERFEEVVRNANFATPWDTHPNRMHRHKTLIQCARVAFGFAGIYDDDEAARIIEATGSIDSETGEVIGRKPAVAMPQAKVTPKTTETTDGVTDVQPKGEQSTPAVNADLATVGEIAYILKKINNKGTTIAEARELAGLDKSDKLDGLTKDGFIALKDALV